jgi:hypothetical protein
MILNATGERWGSNPALVRQSGRVGQAETSMMGIDYVCIGAS